MKKKFFIIIVLIIIITIVVFVFFSRKKNEYVFETVSRKNIIGMVSESGTVVSSGGTYVYSSTNGIVDKVYVNNGDIVKEKQKLFSVKSTSTPQQRAESYALYQAAKSAVQQAENTRRSTLSTVDRVHDDVKDNNSTESFLEKETRTIAEVAHDNAYDALLSAKANLVSAQANYNALLNSIAVAPVSGIISNLAINTGSMVLANSVISPADPVLFIKIYSPTEIIITLGENDINKIKIGQKANIKFDAIENKNFEGNVQRFDEKGTIAQGVARYNVYISVSSFDENIKSGMTADVDIITNELTNVLVISNAAVKPYQKGRAIRILNKDNQIQYLPVKIGVKGKEFTQIIEGVNEGQQIIVSSGSEVAPKASMFKL